MFNLLHRHLNLYTSIAMAPDGVEGGGDVPAAPAASEAPASAPEESSDATDVDWNQLGSGEEDLDEVFVEDPAKQDPPPSSEPPKTEPEKKEAPKQPEAPAPIEPKKEEPKAPEQPATPPGQKEEPSPSEPEDPWAKFEKDKPTIIANMAKQRYAFSKEELDQLEANPGETLSQLAAKVHTELFADVLKAVSGMMPQAFHHFQSETVANNAAVDSFKQAWPQIDVSKYGSDIAMAAELVAKSNPSATQAQRIALVGAMIVAQHKLAAAPPANPSPTPPAPPPAPFAPARPGVATPPPPVTVEEFSGLGVDFEE